MSLVEDLQDIKDGLQPLALEFGLPQYRRIWVRRQEPLQSGSLIPGLKDYPISPTPRIETLKPSLVSELMSRDTIQLDLNDFIVKHISRKRISKEGLTRDVEMFIVDPEVSNGSMTGIRCKLVYLDDSKALGWTIILKRMSDKSSIPIVPMGGLEGGF